MKAKTFIPTWTGIALLVVLVATPATAQKGEFEIGLGAGFTSLDDKLGGDAGLGLELRAGYFVTDRFELELRSTQASSMLDGSFSAYTLNVIYHLADREGLVPYVLVGAGIADVEVDALFRDPLTDESTALRAAVGTRSRFGEAQRGSVRTELSALSEDSFNDRSTHVSLTVILGWHFGG